MKAFTKTLGRAAVAGAALMLGTAALAQSTADQDEVASATTVPAGVLAILEARMKDDPSGRIPLVIRHAARCVAVFPNVIKAGVIVAGKRGKGLVSCRDSATRQWGPPLFYNLSELSVGLQAGIQSASIMFLIVDDKGLERLLDEKLTFGGDVSVAAGPLGAGKQVNVDSSVVSYARSEGVFAGVQLGSSAVTFDSDTTTAAYGKVLDPADVLFDMGTALPKDLEQVRDALARFAPAKD